MAAGSPRVPGGADMFVTGSSSRLYLPSVFPFEPGFISGSSDRRSDFGKPGGTAFQRNEFALKVHA